MPYAETGPKRYYEDMILPEYYLDMHRSFRLSAFQAITQNVSSMELAALGYPYLKLKDCGYVYLLVWDCMKFYRDVEAWETVRVFTWHQFNKGARSYRNFVASTLDGEMVAEASTAWVLADAVSHRIVNPEVSPIPIPSQPELFLEVGEAGKIKMPKDLTPLGERTVRYTDMDYNGHMSNTVYSDIFCDYCGVDFTHWQVDEYSINFRKEALLHDTLILSGKTAEEDGFPVVYMTGAVDGAASFDAVARFKPRESRK